VAEHEVTIAPPDGGGGVRLEITGNDPWITAVARAETAACHALELRYAVTAGRLGQVFWMRDGAGDAWFAEERSVQFPLIADGAIHVYRLDLGAHPLFRGRLAALRVDLTDAPASARLVAITLRASSATPTPTPSVSAPASSPTPTPSASPPPIDPGRDAAAVCRHWRAERVDPNVEWEPTPDSNDTCDPGRTTDAAQQAALRRVNAYRWLVGLGPVRLAPHLYAQQQACATLLFALGHLDHHPPATAPCYTPEGAAGCGSSNLALGTSLAGSVDLYVQDSGVASLGHRRWVLSPTLAETAFGIKGAMSCMFTFSWSGSEDPDFVAWPPPGYVPADAAAGAFSFVSSRLGFDERTRVEVAIDDGPFEEVRHQVLQWGFGWGSALSFQPPGNPWSVWQAGRRVRVAVRGLTPHDVEYEVQFVACP
jgi:hypothetical protein